MDHLLGATEDLLDSLKPRTLFGHSMGGWLAAHYSTSCGEGKRPLSRAAGLTRDYAGPESVILASPAGVCLDADARGNFGEIFRRAAIEDFEPLRTRLFAREPFWFRAMAREYSGFARREDIKRFLASVGDEHYVHDRIGAIRSPVWLLWGDSDRLCQTGWLAHWLERIPAARGVLFPGVGHTPQLECPLSVAAVVSRILSGRETEDPGSLLPWKRQRWKVVEADQAKDSR
jgi:pimeloyl-ACP methyl ester carboxylesterase